MDPGFSAKESIVPHLTPWPPPFSPVKVLCVRPDSKYHRRIPGIRQTASERIRFEAIAAIRNVNRTNLKNRRPVR